MAARAVSSNRRGETDRCRVGGLESVQANYGRRRGRGALPGREGLRCALLARLLPCPRGAHGARWSAARVRRAGKPPCCGRGTPPADCDRGRPGQGCCSTRPRSPHVGSGNSLCQRRPESCSGPVRSQPSPPPHWLPLHRGDGTHFGTQFSACFPTPKHRLARVDGRPSSRRPSTPALSRRLWGAHKWSAMGLANLPFSASTNAEF